MTMAPPNELPELDASAFQPLVDHLSKHSISVNRYRRGVGVGRSQCFGMVRKRSMAPDLSRQSWVDPKLHYLLMKFALMYMPPGFTFTSVQVNENFTCEAHFDKHNRGNSYIVGFGSYTGGELVLKEPGPRGVPEDKDYNIRHRPMLFDGSKIEHYTKEFQGRRWSIVYHTLVPPSKFPMVRRLEDYEAVSKDGQWVIAWTRQGEPTVYLSKKNGLAHPLKGRKKVVEKPEVSAQQYDLRLTAAQNLMVNSRIPDTISDVS
jgi:hypothetical protein